MFFINGLDQPTTAKAIEDIRYFGDLVKSVGAPHVYFRGDINHLHDIQKLVPGWDEQRMLDRLAPVLDLWCAVADFQRTDFSVLLNRRRTVNPNLVVWFYQNREPSVGGYTLDDETIGLATWPVIAWKYGLAGCILWETSFTGPSKNIWVDPNNTVSKDGRVVHNLAGFGDAFDKIGIARGLAAMAALNKVMGRCLYEPGRPYGAAGDWSHNPEDWNLMRIVVLEAISK